MRVLLCALLSLLFLSSCARQAPPTVRPALPSRPVVVWIDAAWMHGELASPPRAELVLRSLADAGVTTVAFESLDWDGQPTSPQVTPLREQARKLGLATAAVVPCFTPKPDDPPSLLSHVATWDRGAWQVAPLTPPRLSPAVVENQERLLAHLATLPDPLVILSGFGFEDMAADVGPAARHSFESWSASSSRDWPSEVLASPPPRMPWGPEGRGPQWNSWTLWRADLLSKLMLRIRGALPATTNLIVMADAPFQVHQRQGLNWAWPGSSTTAEHPWLVPQYGATSVTHLIDGLALTYWEPGLVKREEAMVQGYAWWASMEGSGSAAAQLLPSTVRPWSTVLVRPDGDWTRSITAARGLGGGVLIAGLGGKLVSGADWARLGGALR
jgi:hypothetical protein